MDVDRKSKFRIKLRHPFKKIPHRRANDQSPAAVSTVVEDSAGDQSIQVLMGEAARKQKFVLKPGEFVSMQKIPCPVETPEYADKEIVRVTKVSKEALKVLPKITIFQAVVDTSTREPEVKELLFYRDPFKLPSCDAAVNTEPFYIPLGTEGEEFESTLPCFDSSMEKSHENAICRIKAVEKICSEKHIHHFYPTYICDKGHSHTECEEEPVNDDFVCIEGHVHRPSYTCEQGHKHLGYPPEGVAPTFICEEGHEHPTSALISTNFECEDGHLHEGEPPYSIVTLCDMGHLHETVKPYICDAGHRHPEDAKDQYAYDHKVLHRIPEVQEEGEEQVSSTTSPNHIDIFIKREIPEMGSVSVDHSAIGDSFVSHTLKPSMAESHIPQTTMYTFRTDRSLTQTFNTFHQSSLRTSTPSTTFHSCYMTEKEGPPLYHFVNMPSAQILPIYHPTRPSSSVCLATETPQPALSKESIRPFYKVQCPPTATVTPPTEMATTICPTQSRMNIPSIPEQHRTMAQTCEQPRTTFAFATGDLRAQSSTPPSFCSSPKTADSYHTSYFTTVTVAKT